MSKMGQYVIGLIEEGKAYEDINGDLVMSDKYTIEEGIPAPKSVKNQGRWEDFPFDEMMPGNRIAVDDLTTKQDEQSLRGRVTRENKSNTDKFYSVVKNPDKPDQFRVFRIK